MTVSTRSVAVAPAGKLAGEFEADHLGHEHVQRLAEHHRLGLDAADAPADDAQPVDHRGVAVGARPACRARRPARRRRCAGRRPWPGYSRFTWCTMPIAGGTTRKLSKAFWPQRRNS